jgi:bifunctional DNase/RNase
MLLEMTIRGLMMDPVTNLPIVILRDEAGQHVLPILVGAVEANAVALQIENVAPPRPLTHDLIRHILQDFGVRVVRVVIHDIADNTFFAFLDLAQGETRSRIDVRPSDALAIALRTKAPIFVNSRILERSTIADISAEDADPERLQKWLESLDPDDLGYKM